ncbi:uncharacterized protein LOC142225363 [Haematobia irritans]|uniref:uncharacterized protein LOC142225363 n=1 Tax=Haematobia irritans TaxID=7368 RepID=UPI003F4F8573
MDIKTIHDMESVAEDIERCLENPIKAHLVQIINGFVKLLIFLDHREPGIYTLAVKWFRLYMKLQLSIELRNDHKLSRQFERSIPTAITYIIATLQYKIDETDYHYELLSILEELLQRSKEEMLQTQFAEFENGTIASIWTPIKFMGDFQAQLLALKIYAKIMKTLESKHQEEELKMIKLTNLKLFKDKLKRVIEKSENMYALENACRDLLNNYNMILSHKFLIYSFYCKTATLGKNIELFKPQFCDKFWVDMNCKRCSISFRCRYKMTKKSLKLENMNITLKWKTIQIQKDSIAFTIDYKSEICKLPKDIAAKLTNGDTVNFILPQLEVNRMKDNERLVEYFERNGSIECIGSNTAEVSTNIKTPIKEEPKESVKPINSQQRRKFFSKAKVDTKKKTPDNTTRITKAQRKYKAPICAVVPMIDLTKSPKNNGKPSLSRKDQIIDICNEVPKQSELNDNQVKAVLNGVNTICYNSKIYENFGSQPVTEPCQSYRSLKTRYAPYQLPTKSNQTKSMKKSQCDLSLKAVNNEGNTIILQSPVPANSKTLNSNTRKRKICSQDLFDNTKSDGSSKASINKNSENVDIINCPETPKKRPKFAGKGSNSLNSPDSLPRTPTSRNLMFVSDIDDMPTLSEQSDKENHFLVEGSRTEKNILFGNSNIKEIKNYSKSSHIPTSIGTPRKFDGCIIYNNCFNDTSDSDDSGDNTDLQRNYENGLNISKSIQNTSNISPSEKVQDNCGLNTNFKDLLYYCKQQAPNLDNSHNNIKEFNFKRNFSSSSKALMSLNNKTQNQIIDKVCNHLDVFGSEKCDVNNNNHSTLMENIWKINYETLVKYLGLLLIMKSNHVDVPKGLAIKNIYIKSQPYNMDIQLNLDNQNTSSILRETMTIKELVQKDTKTVPFIALKENLTSSYAKCFLNICGMIMDSNYGIITNSSDIGHMNTANQEISAIINDYITRTDNIIIDLRKSCISRFLDNIKYKMCGITENVIKLCEENKRDLENIQISMEKLIKKMVCLHEIYEKKADDYKRYQEIFEHSLSAMANLNKEAIVAEYKVMKEKFTVIEHGIRKDTWKNYFVPKQEEILYQLNCLSNINK